MDLTKAKETISRYRGCGSTIAGTAVWAVAEVERLTKENSILAVKADEWQVEAKRLRAVLCDVKADLEAIALS